MRIVAESLAVVAYLGLVLAAVGLSTWLGWIAMHHHRRRRQPQLPTPVPGVGMEVEEVDENLVSILLLVAFTADAVIALSLPIQYDAVAAYVHGKRDVDMLGIAKYDLFLITVVAGATLLALRLDRPKPKTIKNLSGGVAVTFVPNAPSQSPRERLTEIRRKEDA